jgi:hypothetical protein
MTVDDLEKAVATLPPEQFAKFREWFEGPRQRAMRHFASPAFWEAYRELPSAQSGCLRLRSGSAAFPVTRRVTVFGETQVPGSGGLRPIVHDGKAPGGGVAILGDRLF